MAGAAAVVRSGAATAGIVSAAVLAVPGCGPVAPAERRDETVERASFRALAARQFLATCPGAAGRAETRRQEDRHEELKQLAARKDLGHSIWLGENQWRGVSRYDREMCGEGEPAYREALAAFGGELDELARRVAEAPR